MENHAVSTSPFQPARCCGHKTADLDAPTTPTPLYYVLFDWFTGSDTHTSNNCSNRPLKFVVIVTVTETNEVMLYLTLRCHIIWTKDGWTTDESDPMTNTSMSIDDVVR